MNSQLVPPGALSVIKELQEAGFQAFLVGGCVRDMLRGHHPHDWDIATSAKPESVQAIFAKTIPTGIAHGTVTVVWDGDLFEVTTFRSEGDYSDGRRPDSVQFETDIVADLSRRDFTINAMAFNPTTGELVDPFGGQQDIYEGLIRCVGDANKRFQEDGLRCMRAIRFAATFGYVISAPTYVAIEPNIEVFKMVAMERIESEFVKILMSDNPTAGMLSLKTTGLLHAILPAGTITDGFEMLDSCKPDLETRLAVLVRANSGYTGSLAPLKLPTAVMKRVEELVSHPMPGHAASDKEVRIFLRAIIGSERNSAAKVHRVLQAIDVAWAMGNGVSENLRHRLLTLIDNPLFQEQLALDGFGVMEALGVKSGPLVGKANRVMMDLVLTDPKNNNVETLKAALRGLTLAS